MLPPGVNPASQATAAASPAARRQARSGGGGRMLGSASPEEPPPPHPIYPPQSRGESGPARSPRAPPASAGLRRGSSFPAPPPPPPPPRPPPASLFFRFSAASGENMRSRAEAKPLEIQARFAACTGRLLGERGQLLGGCFLLPIEKQLHVPPVHGEMHLGVPLPQSPLPTCPCPTEASTGWAQSLFCPAWDTGAHKSPVPDALGRQQALGLYFGI